MSRGLGDVYKRQDGALPVEEARAYAERHDIPMLTGDDLLEHYGNNGAVN